MTYGFIITRHVNSLETNRYWNHCIKLIRRFYHQHPIVVIDDNSNKQFVKEDYHYKNVTIVESEYPGRGELLPFIYYIKNPWFENAVIIHDSVYIHKKINFDMFQNIPVLPLWYAPYDHEFVDNLVRMSFVLKHSQLLFQKLKKTETKILGVPPLNAFNVCFGCQCYISRKFLIHLNEKYNLTNLIQVVRCRKDRCGLERIMGLLFHEEFKDLYKIKSLFGNIMSHYKSFGYNSEDYMKDMRRQRILKEPFIKIWTGR